MHKSIRSLALVGLFVGSGALARADEPGKATTPKACVEGMVACVKKQDFDGAAAYMMEPYRATMGKMLKVMITGAAAEEKLKAALESKFGPDGATGFNLKARGKGGPFDGDVEVLDVKEEGDKATVKTKNVTKEGPPKEETVHCEKVEGFWFMNPDAGGRKRNTTPEQEAKMADVMAGALGQVATDTEALAGDIQSGKVATKEEARTKHGEIQQKLMQAMMGGAGQPPRLKPGGGKGGEKPPEKPENPGKGGE